MADFTSSTLIAVTQTGLLVLKLLAFPWHTDTICRLTSFLRKLCMLLRLPRSANFEATPITIKLVSDDKTISTHADTPAHKHTKYTITAWKQKSKSKPITSFFSAKTATKQTRGVSQTHLEMHVTEPEGEVEKMDVDTLILAIHNLNKE